jgi:hypothetical protein
LLLLLLLLLNATLVDGSRRKEAHTRLRDLECHG